MNVSTEKTWRFEKKVGKSHEAKMCGAQEKCRFVGYSGQVEEVK